MENLESELKLALNNFKKNNFTDNHDFRRFSGDKHSLLSIKKIVRNLYKIFGYYRFGANRKIFNNIKELSWLYDQLDAQSKELLVQLLSYRILGEKHVKLPLSISKYWEDLEELDLLFSRGEKFRNNMSGWQLKKACLDKYGYPLEIFSLPISVYTQMVLEHYRCVTENSVIDICEGDIVIDAGGCFGDTALCFSVKTGEGGRVFSWEFEPGNLQVFKRNLALNPDYSSQIELIEKPLWSSPGDTLYVTGVGPSTQVNIVPPKDGEKVSVVTTYTIDSLCADRGLSSVDFIKMDIEGAELEALKGAVDTITRFKPKLAISVYHNIEDFWEIPQWINSLNLGYKFHLRHFTIHAEETVLFAEICY